jgi:hypothetical protein
MNDEKTKPTLNKTTYCIMMQCGKNSRILLKTPHLDLKALTADALERKEETPKPTDVMFYIKVSTPNGWLQLHRTPKLDLRVLVNGFAGAIKNMTGETETQTAKRKLKR